TGTPFASRARWTLVIVASPIQRPAGGSRWRRFHATARAFRLSSRWKGKHRGVGVTGHRRPDHPGSRGNPTRALPPTIDELVARARAGGVPGDDRRRHTARRFTEHH